MWLITIAADGREEVKALRDEGLTWHQVAERLGVSYETARQAGMACAFATHRLQTRARCFEVFYYQVESTTSESLYCWISGASRLRVGLG